MPTTPNRRSFLGSAGAAMAAAPLARAANVHSGADQTLRVGLVGCGGRGAQAAYDALLADPDTKLVAIGDAFADRAEQCLGDLNSPKEGELARIADQIAVAPELVFSGFDAYRHVIDHCDVVLLATPPHFRPQHLDYAVDQGRHVFCEKPVAVDAPGVRQVLEASRRAKEKNLSLVSGLCWRYDLGVRETMRRVLEDRAIGDIVAIESSYNTGALWHRGDDPKWSRMEYQIRNWLYHTWLSGDHIVEQAIHSLDKTAWLLGDQSPVSAMALGGRQQRTEAKFGNVFDHFSVFYTYPSGQRVYFTCRQQAGTGRVVDERVLGVDGEAEILRHKITPKGGKRWRYRGPKPTMYQVEHQELFKSIRDGEPINNGDYMCNSTMIAIMGRMAAYSGKTLTWDQCFNSDKRLGPTEYAWTDIEQEPVAIPGRTDVV